MSLLELFAIAVGLSMDAFAVSVCKGLSLRRYGPGRSLTAGIYFGGFQALMPLIGWALGVRFQQAIANVDHWIAFGLLTLIGINMLREARQEAGEMKRRMEEQKLIDRAKAILAQKEQIAEGEAYRRLQKLAMEKRVPLIALAEKVVSQQSSREAVNRAKEQLMRRQGLSEPEAYRLISQTARTRNITLEQAARELQKEKE